MAIERYQNLIRNSWQQSDEAQAVLRRQASQLMGKANSIPMYDICALLRWVPNRKNIILASQQLIGLSNSRNEGGTSKTATIADLLNMKVVVERYKSS